MPSAAQLVLAIVGALLVVWIAMLAVPALYHDALYVLIVASGVALAFALKDEGEQRVELLPPV